MGLKVLADGMVHFLEIEKIFNNSTKTILWLNNGVHGIAWIAIKQSYHPPCLVSTRGMGQEVCVLVPVVRIDLGAWLEEGLDEEREELGYPD